MKTPRNYLLLALMLLLMAGVVAQSPAMNTILHREIQPADSARYFYSFDSVKIHYEVKGMGFPVLLVHGFTGTGEGWKKSAVYQDLLQQGYQVILIDLRGNGLSDKPHVAEAYANDAEAKDIMTLLTRLGISQYNVVGYSRGSIITARLLVLDKRVSRAVLGGIGIDFTNPDWPRRIRFYKALSGEPDAELEPMVKRVKESGLDQLALAYQQKEQPSTPVAALAAIRQPVMVICGTADSDNGSAVELAKVIPGSMQASCPGDHGAAVRTPEFGAQVISFFKVQK